MKHKKPYLFIILLIISIFGYSYFRSYIDHEQFLVALDKVTSIVIRELWRLISSPTIFVVLAVAFLIYSFRDEILQFFPAIKEIKAGAFSAILDSSQIIKFASVESISQEMSKELGTKKKQEDVIDYLLSRLGKSTLEFILEMDGKNYEPDKLLEIMGKYHVGEAYIDENVYNNLDTNAKSLYRLGSLLVLIKVIFPAIFDSSIVEELDGVKKSLKTGVAEKIQTRLKEIKTNQTTVAV